ncbi:hypothetical protein J3E68DRAFT_361965 [Trichoderma sp. SZMC 28012]
MTDHHHLGSSMETGRQLLNGWMDGYLFFLIFHLLVYPQIGSEAETCILESTPRPGERHLRFPVSDEAARLQDQPPLKGVWPSANSARSGDLFGAIGAFRGVLAERKVASNDKCCAWGIVQGRRLMSYSRSCARILLGFGA